MDKWTSGQMDILFVTHAWLHFHLSICPFVLLSFCPHVHLSTCPFVHMSICPFVLLFDVAADASEVGVECGFVFLVDDLDEVFEF